jgi:hypothetical protein
MKVRRGSGEMADTPVLGTGASACGFKSRLPHNEKTITRKGEETPIGGDACWS